MRVAMFPEPMMLMLLMTCSFVVSNRWAAGLSLGDR